MSKIRIYTVKISLFIMMVSFLISIALSIRINQLTPRYSVQSLESAQITHLKNAYINTTRELVGLKTNRQQFKYATPDDFKINTSGNISVYTFEQDFEGNIALSQSEYTKTLNQSKKLERERKPFSKFKQYSLIILAISTIIFFGTLITSSFDELNIKKDES